MPGRPPDLENARIKIGNINITDQIHTIKNACPAKRARIKDSAVTIIKYKASIRSFNCQGRSK